MSTVWQYARNGVTYELEVQDLGPDRASNTSQVEFWVRVHHSVAKLSGTQAGSVTIGGSGMTGQTYTFNTGYNFANGTTVLLYAKAASNPIAHKSDGTMQINIAAHFNASGLGAAVPVGGNIALISSPPQPPIPVSVTATTPTVATTWKADTGSTVDNWIAQLSANNTFTSILQEVTLDASVLAYTFTGLNPRVEYYVRWYSSNASGKGYASNQTPIETPIDRPAAPTKLTATSVGPFGMTIGWATPSYTGQYGRNPDTYVFRYSVNPDMSAAVTKTGTWTTSYKVTGLLAGTTYYFDVAGVTSAGTGNYSIALSKSTLPTTSPTLSLIQSDSSGQTSTVTYVPPSGVSKVDSYTLTVTDSVTGAVTTWVTTSGSQVVTALRPGRSYSYSAYATINGFNSPSSAPQSYTQARPSLNPGSYFDGSSTAADQTYSWSGTANASTSIATGKVVTGWIATATVGSVVAYQVTGGVSGGSCIRMMVTSDLQTPYSYSNASFLMLMNTATVTTGTGAAVVGNNTYDASIYLNPSKSCYVTIGIRWYDSTGTYISSDFAYPGIYVSSSAGYQRIDHVATAPSNATFAVIEVGDLPDGSGNWVQLVGGDYIEFDAAMLTLNKIEPYFDGSTKDTVLANYSWIGAANASASQWTPLVASTSEALQDPTVTAIPKAPSAPMVPNPALLNINEWLRYWIPIDPSEIGSSQVTIPTFSIATGINPVQNVRIRVYENPDNVAAVNFDGTAYDYEQIITYIPPETAIVIDGVSERVWASVLGDDPIPADGLLFGTGGVPATWPVLSCGIPYLISVDTALPSYNPGAIAIDVALTRRL